LSQNEEREGLVSINVMQAIPEMIAGESYLFAIVYRPGMGIQCCSEVPDFLFDGWRT
jgi:hypothetical protein